MGGTVSVIFRLESGELYQMRRWTNPLPSFYQNIKFFEKDSEHIRAYLKRWEDMRDDWIRNHESKTFAFEMTEVYAPYPATIAPCSYGIVVFDFKKNVVVSCQGYTSFNRVYCVPEWYDREAHEAQIELYKGGRVKEIQSYGSEGSITLPVPDSLEDFMIFFEDRARCHLILDTSPFTIHEFQDDYDGFRSAKKIIRDLGFRLHKDDRDDWKSFMKDRKEMG